MPRHLLAAVCLALAGALPVFAADPPPAEAEVRALLGKVEHASQERNLAALAALLAADCRIELITRINGREQVTLLTRDEYLGMLSHGYAAMKDLEHYDYSVSNLTISYDREPPGATVTSLVHESFALEGRAVATDSRERSRIERRDGVLKLVAVSAETEGR